MISYIEQFFVEVWFIEFIRKWVKNNKIKNTNKTIIYINIKINTGVALLSLL